MFSTLDFFRAEFISSINSLSMFMVGGQLLVNLEAESTLFSAALLPVFRVNHLAS